MRDFNFRNEQGEILCDFCRKVPPTDADDQDCYALFQMPNVPGVIGPDGQFRCAWICADCGGYYGSEPMCDFCKNDGTDCGMCGGNNGVRAT